MFPITNRRHPRRPLALIAGIVALAVAAPAAANATGTTAPSTGGSDADFCLDTPPGTPVNEYNCPLTTMSTTAPSRPRTTVPRVRTKPHYTG